MALPIADPAWLSRSRSLYRLTFPLVWTWSRSGVLHWHLYVFTSHSQSSELAGGPDSREMNRLGVTFIWNPPALE